MEATELADLKNMANDCLMSRRKATLVLDGLDEMSGRLEVLLSSYPQIGLDMIDAHQQDIDQFIKDKVADIHTRFPLKQQEEETLVSKISSASQGIFLYARLVLDHLAAMDSIQDFEDESEDDTFPEDLDRVYDRIAQRIMKKPGSSRHKTVKKILGWVICATRPLRWREIQSRFCIDADKEICNIKGLRRDSFVSMVHETPARYRVRNGTINLVEEHINMDLFCCRYLSSRPFTTGKSQSISADIHSGYFGFLDYAAAHYIVHIREVETSEVSTFSASRLEAVKAAVVGLAKANCKEISLQAEQSDKATKDLNLAIQVNVLTVRTLIGLQRENSETAIFEATEGPKRHKRYKIQCSKFATGSSSETAFKEHLARLESHNVAFHHTTSKAKAKAVFPAELETGEWNLYEACKAGNLDEVKKFHREGVDLNSTHPEAVSPLCAAVEAGHGHVCRYFIDNGVDPFRQVSNKMASRAAVASAIYREHLEILEFLLHSGSSPDDSDLVENITYAIHSNHSAALNILLTARQPK
ncbi:Alpha-latrotoxin-Lh1a [Fusarium oxysporum f. sp. rapae]|uniref:Alpha-latrotoxin-Lh1a n=1 Tax=Fusarium oxysporum f. sp. rapae TaxID=485398 RepID=A0A8J5NYI9_FUSOX|nr:Alpha-latrotoxin-Lh1a [Fusarium oxysporum f. sp. rapae]